MKRINLTLAPGGHLGLGLMSGTSHDGISAALVEIDEQKRPAARVLAFESYPYEPEFRARLLEASAGDKIDAQRISSLNFELGSAFGRAANRLIRASRIQPRRLSFIGSHGHTFAHLPPRRTKQLANPGLFPSTLQLGESAVIAAMTGVPIVADFRPMDLALGGEGAPLAPLAHVWFFADPRRGRIIQNIGGIGNATWLRPARSRERISPIAFDTGPGVMMIDALAARQTNGRARMDVDGRIAAGGNVNEKLLAGLMRHPYFRRRPPKSTGREEFGLAYLEEIEGRASRAGLNAADLMATVTALTARSIADAAKRFILPLGRVDQLIVTGGGARNPVLVEMIARAMDGVAVMASEEAGVDGDSLEAAAFAILAYRMLRGKPGNLPSVTGARAPAILGKLTLPPNWRG